MSRLMYNGRTARDWYYIWQEDTDALQRKVVELQQKLDQAEAEAGIWQEATARLEREKWGLPHPDPETAYD